jgi:ligand-binding SRPBCC domain-containing protein
MKRRLPIKVVTAVGLAAAAVLFPWKPRRYTLQRQQLIERPIDEVFAFFEDPRNLAKITPPEMGFEIKDIQGLPVGVGTRIEYVIRIFGLPQRWVAEIAEYEAGRRFVDVQVKGPYRYWRHEHSFEPLDVYTVMTDQVEYELPFGLAGQVAHVVVARQLQRIFDYRTLVIDRAFESASPASSGR